MKRSKMNPEPRRATWGAAILLALGLAFACGESTSAESGETHFLNRCTENSCGAGLECLCGVCSRPCGADTSCAGLPGAAACIEQADSCGAPIVCDVGCASDADCASVGANHRCEAGACRAGNAVPVAGCSEGCDTVFGYPEDPALGGVDLGRLVAIGCDCDASIDPAAEPLRCERRADGRLLLVPDIDFAMSEPLATCTPDEAERSSTSTDFAGCGERPRAVCRVDAFCDQTGCGGPEFDENGCKRQSCAGDGDCAPTEQCTAVESVTISSCQTYADACQCGGILLPGPPGAFCTPRPPLGELCDGSNEVRLFAHSGGGFVAESYAFVSPYGSSVLAVLGTCEYYAQSDARGAWVRGTLSQAEAETLAESVAFERLPEFDAFRDSESCPDAGGQYLQTAGAAVMCTCGCGDSAPAGLEDAMSSASQATTDYAARGEAVTGGAVTLVALVHTEVPETPPVETPEWTLGFPITEALIAGAGALDEDSGRRVEDAADVTELRRLRSEYPGENVLSDYVFVHDANGAVYGILVRDELPAAVAASLDALEAELDE